MRDVSLDLSALKIRNFNEAIQQNHDMISQQCENEMMKEEGDPGDKYKHVSINFIFKRKTSSLNIFLLKRHYLNFL